jgi:hypothetical protein
MDIIMVLLQGAPSALVAVVAFAVLNSKLSDTNRCLNEVKADIKSIYGIETECKNERIKIEGEIRGDIQYLKGVRNGHN